MARPASRARSTTLMVKLAKRGKRVVRLKGGDPMIFGRAGEEIAACRAANIPVEVVPGISAAQGAAARLLRLADASRAGAPPAIRHRPRPRRQAAGRHRLARARRSGRDHDRLHAEEDAARIERARDRARPRSGDARGRDRERDAAGRDDRRGHDRATSPTGSRRRARRPGAGDDRQGAGGGARSGLRHQRACRRSGGGACRPPVKPRSSLPQLLLDRPAHRRPLPDAAEVIGDLRRLVDVDAVAVEPLRQREQVGVADRVGRRPSPTGPRTSRARSARSSRRPSAAPCASCVEVSVRVVGPAAAAHAVRVRDVHGRAQIAVERLHLREREGIVERRELRGGKLCAM